MCDGLSCSRLRLVVTGRTSCITDLNAWSDREINALLI